MSSEPDFDEAAVQRLRTDAAALEHTAEALRDSIAGNPGYADGGVYVPHIAGAAQSVLLAVGRLANTLDKAASAIHHRADQAYIDRLGAQVDARAEVEAISDDLFTAALGLSQWADRHYGLIARLATLGQR